LRGPLIPTNPEAVLDDLRGPPARERVRERVLRGLEQLEQLVVDGDVEAREVRVERLDLIAGRLRNELDDGGGHPDWGCRFIHVKREGAGAGGLRCGAIAGHRHR
jgi:hypothetical protein